MTENNERRFYRGSAGWVIIGILAAVAVIFGVILAFGSMLFPTPPGTETQSETADQSATSGPGHNTTMEGSVPSGGQEEEVIADSPPASPDQIPDSDITFGRETSTLETPQAGDMNNTANRTNGGLENPLSGNITSLTGT